MLIDKQILISIKNTKHSLIICTIFFICGILLSLFYKTSEDGFLLSCTKIVDIVTSDISISYYIKRLICEILILTIVSACGLLLYSIPLIFIILSYRGFLLGLAIKIILINYSISGLTILIFIVIPSSLISSFALAISCTLSCDMLKKCTGFKKVKAKNLLNNYIFTLIITFASVIYILIMQIIIIIPLNYSF